MSFDHDIYVDVSPFDVLYFGAGGVIETGEKIKRNLTSTRENYFNE